MKSAAVAPTPVERANAALMPNYGDRDLMIVRGEGARCWDTDGREFLDFLGGIAVNSVGHCHPQVVEAIRRQAGELIHCSNTFLIGPQAELAERLCAAAGMERAFFCNSGCEATEAAIKLSRLHALKTRGVGHSNIMVFEGSFHGRTYGAMSATWSKKVREGFEPLAPGFVFAKLNDIESVDAAWDDSIAAVMVETIQGEGGVTPCTREFLRALRERCTERGALLITDEIQCGMGRSGRAFAFQFADIEPDLVPIAKAVGGGLPLGALLARGECALAFHKGSHGSTFGGNPVACAAGLAVCDIVFDEGFLRSVEEKGRRFQEALRKIAQENVSLVEGVRGMGLMVGLVLSIPGADIVKYGREAGLLFNCTADRVLRFLPPLTITNEDVDRAAAIVRGALAHYVKEQWITETAPPTTS